jgi:uncharacterized protein (TIGR03435 family)
MPVYALVIGKGGLKMKEVEMGPGSSNLSGTKLTARKITMARFAEHLSGLVDRPVVDMTGSPGVYDYDLEWTKDAAGPEIYTAIQQQLGLRLETRKAPVEMLVIDRAEKTPIEN